MYASLVSRKRILLKVRACHRSCRNKYRSWIRCHSLTCPVSLHRFRISRGSGFRERTNAAFRMWKSTGIHVRSQQCWQLPSQHYPAGKSDGSRIFVVLLGRQTRQNTCYIAPFGQCLPRFVARGFSTWRKWVQFIYSNILFIILVISFKTTFRHIPVVLQYNIIYVFKWLSKCSSTL